MLSSNDLMLIFEPDAAAQTMLREIAERLGCEHVETDSPQSLREVLGVRRPTLAVLAVDRATDGFSVIDALVEQDARPVTLLVGAIGPRLLASAKRAAELRNHSG